MGDWLAARAADLGRQIEAGVADPVEITEAYLSAIAEHPFAVRIYARVTPERARAEARAARERARAGLRRSPLDGVPVSWKDLFDSAGVATEAGSALLEGRVPGADAEVLNTATAMGLVCLGKTHMTELAFSGLGLNPSTASPPCVNDPAAVAGGSSSGAATSVAFGLAAAGIGSDTGGSIRIPSAWNDLVGFKPTHGRLSLEGVAPLCPRFDTVGPLCRSVEDAALLVAALEGSVAADPGGAELSGMRFLVLESVAFDEIREGPRAGFEDAVARLAAAGATVERGGMPGLDAAMDLARVIYTTEAYGTWGKEIEAAPEKMFAEVRERFRAGRDVLGAEYVAAWQALERHRRAWAERVAGYDAVILPTCPILPPDKARLETEPGYFVSENLMALRNTRIGNMLGLAALTLPTGTPSAGIMFMILPGTDDRLLQIGAAAEKALS